MATSIETWFFATVVVRDGDRFVLVHESDGSWGLPGGRLEVGEAFSEGARRETQEEAGIDVVLAGVLELEHSPLGDGRSRMGLAFVGRAADGVVLKSQPDAESNGAAWFQLVDLDTLPLRSSRVARLVRLALADAPLLALDRIVSLTPR